MCFFSVFDSKRLAIFIIGLLLFGYSAQLSHNLLFYYLCGITVGVTASFVIIIILISRFIPKVCILFTLYIIYMYVCIVLFVLCFRSRKN